MMTRPWVVTLVLSLASIGAVTFLADSGKVTGDAVVAILTGVLGFGGGAAAVSHGVKQGSEASVSPPPEG